MASKESGKQTVDLAVAILGFAKGHAAPGMNPGQIGAALAGATVYFARECGLDDAGIGNVMVSAMATRDGKRIGPVHD